MNAKRLLDIVCAAIGLVALAPIFMLIALWIKSDSPGPVFFRQMRVGQDGKMFQIYKFRTMVVQAENLGGKITSASDPRITPSGAVLRHYKLDELPQLINVLKGEMSLVGPRPEVPEFVAYYPEELRKRILSVRPGITDPASIEFRNESDLLSGSQDPQRVYLQKILPLKIAHYDKYIATRSFWLDIKLVFWTLKEIFR